MMRKGYLQRLMEELADIMLRIKHLKASGDTPSVLSEIKEAGKSLVGFDTEGMLRFTDATLLSLLTSGNSLDAGKAVVGGALLDAQAKVYAEQGDEEAARASRHKALVLLTAALREEPDLNTEEWRTLITRIHAAQKAQPPA